MILALDFDGTLVVADGRPFEDVVTPLQLRDGAYDALRSMKAAGHVHMLWSARANRSLLFTPEWDPLYGSGFRPVQQKHWMAARDLHWARYFQMLDFVSTRLRGLIDVVDSGLQGKPVVDRFIDDRSQDEPIDWNKLRAKYGAW